MSKTLAEAVRYLLLKESRPVISWYDFVGMLERLYAGHYTAEFEIRTRKSKPSEEDIYRVVQRLREARVVREDPDLGPKFFQAFDVLEQPAEVVCCEVDPFCYVSHLSAMQIHGLTDRSPTDLTLTRPETTLWRQMEEADRKEALQGEIVVRRPRYGFPPRVRGRPVLVHNTKHSGFWEAAGPHVRIATVGQVFLDTVARPSWCGGMVHVLEVWERGAEPHLNEIISRIDTYPVKLPKVRAGYILDELLGIADERVLTWRALAQRGSSQKLDPEKPFAPTFSEAWMLSLNA